MHTLRELGKPLITQPTFFLLNLTWAWSKDERNMLEMWCSCPVDMYRENYYALRVLTKIIDLYYAVCHCFVCKIKEIKVFK